VHGHAARGAQHVLARTAAAMRPSCTPRRRQELRALPRRRDRVQASVREAAVDVELGVAARVAAVRDRQLRCSSSRSAWMAFDSAARQLPRSAKVIARSAVPPFARA
jgi:hypothetical protein